MKKAPESNRQADGSIKAGVLRRTTQFATPANRNSGESRKIKGSALSLTTNSDRIT